MEGAYVAWRGEKCFPPEDKGENSQPVLLLVGCERRRGRPEQLDVSAHGFHTRARDGTGVQIAEEVDGALPIQANWALRILA